MTDENRHRAEMNAALKQIQSFQKRQTKGRRSAGWKLDVSLPKLALQGLGTFCIGILVGMGIFVLFWILFN